MKLPQEFHQKHRKAYLLFSLLLALTAASALFAFSDIQKSKKTANEEGTKEIFETIQNEQKTTQQLEKADQNEAGKQISATTPKKAYESDAASDKGTVKNDPDATPIVEKKTEDTSNTESNPEVETVSATLKISGKTFNIEAPMGGTVLDLMNMAREYGYMTYESKNFGGDLGYFIESINGIKSGDTKNYYWIYYINGAKAKAGISNYTIQQNDIITWNYEKSTL